MDVSAPAPAAVAMDISAPDVKKQSAAVLRPGPAPAAASQPTNVAAMDMTGGAAFYPTHANIYFGHLPHKQPKHRSPTMDQARTKHIHIKNLLCQECLELC